jgi:4-diphosphocytidyl-2-C-methyl-D-erythritol kinase
MKTLKIRAYAKLNLYLDITGRRNDGYHTLKTVMQSIDLYDELEFSLSDGTGIEIICNRSDLPTGNDNLIYKGISAVLDYAYFSPGCKITVKLDKNIPSQAGMGGGSADCAATIVAMNELFHLGFDTDEMRTAAQMCGADVPFCISGGTALCEGIGEKITPLGGISGNDEIYFAVVKPEQAISTPQAYKQFDEKGTLCGGNYARFEQAVGTDAKQLGNALYNAFTDCCELSEVTQAINSLKNSGAFGAEMTGSGSAVYGIFGDRKSAEAAISKCGCKFGGVFTPIDFANSILKG